MAMIFDIQHFSIHNGPGIRTTVFFKGCPLKCAWCHNPESLSVHQDRVFREERCIECNRCLAVCPNLYGGALPLNTSCGTCDLCMKACPTNALEIFGTERTTAQILEEVLKDKVFYQNCGGGVTLSGGEPLFQEAAFLELVKALKRENIHVTLDTSGFASWQTLQHISPYVDLYLFDIKHLNDALHKEGTAVGNVLILENYRKLLQLKARVWVRIPMIPEYNMDALNQSKLIQLLEHYPPEQINLLPYHQTASRKYALLGKTMSNYPTGALYEKDLKLFQRALQKVNLKCCLGG